MSPQDLGIPDQLGELLNLGLSRHVNVFVPNADNHATKDGWISLCRDSTRYK